MEQLLCSRFSKTFLWAHTSPHPKTLHSACHSALDSLVVAMQRLKTSLKTNKSINFGQYMCFRREEWLRGYWHSPQEVQLRSTKCSLSPNGGLKTNNHSITVKSKTLPLCSIATGTYARQIAHQSDLRKQVGFYTSAEWSHGWMRRRWTENLQFNCFTTERVASNRPSLLWLMSSIQLGFVYVFAETLVYRHSHIIDVTRYLN